MYDSHREDKIWVYRPMQSYEIFHDNDINLAIMEEILELLENNSVMQEGLFFEASHFHGNLLRLKQEAFMKVLRYEHALGKSFVIFFFCMFSGDLMLIVCVLCLGGPSVFFLDKLMQAK